MSHNLNCSSRCSRSMRKLCLPVLVRVSALFLAFSSARSYSEEVLLPTPYYTNLLTSVEAWVELHTESAIVLSLDEWDLYYDFLSGEIDDTLTLLELFAWEYQYSYNTVVEYFDDYEQNALAGGNRNWRVFRSSIFRELDSMLGSATSLVSSVSFSLDRVGSALSEISALHTSNVVASVSFGQDYGQTLPGGSCQCPDYSVYLQNIRSALALLYTDFSSYSSSLISLVTDVLDLLDDLDYLANKWDEIGDDWESDLTAFRSGWLSRISSSYSSGSVLASVYSAIWESMGLDGLDSDIPSRIRDFWQFGYIFPTNTPINPLYVATDEDLTVSLNSASDAFLSNVFQVALYGTNDVNICNIDELALAISNMVARIEQDKKDEEEEQQAVYEDEVDSESDALESLNRGGSLSPADPPSFEFFQLFGSLKRAFDDLSSSFDVHGDLELTLFDEMRFQFGEDVEVGADSAVVSAPSESSSTVQSWLQALSTLLWMSLVVFFNVGVVRWVVRLCSVGIAFLGSIASGDLSAFAKLLPKFGDVVASD